MADLIMRRSGGQFQCDGVDIEHPAALKRFHNQDLESPGGVAEAGIAGAGDTS